MGGNCCSKDEVPNEVSATINAKVVEHRSAEPHNEIVESFDPKRTTEELYSVPHFVGDHATVRTLLDYTWHPTFLAGRIDVQDGIINKLCHDENKSDLLPWIVFTAGAMGAGKGHVIRYMDERGYLPLKEFVVVDPDQIRQMLPEWKMYVDHDPETAGEKTQKEAGQIAEILGYKALRHRYRVIFDGSLRDGKWYEKYFQQLRDQFPGIRIMILHIMAEKEEVLRRAEERGKQTGRVIPRQTLLSSMEAVPKSVSQLAPYCDFCCRVMNKTGQDPQVMREPNAPYPPEIVEMNWDTIRGLWENPDLDGDGQLSKEEIDTLIRTGRCRSDVIRSMDLDGDGTITKEEVAEAHRQALLNASKHWK